MLDIEPVEAELLHLIHEFILPSLQPRVLLARHELILIVVREHGLALRLLLLAGIHSDLQLHGVGRDIFALEELLDLRSHLKEYLLRQTSIVTLVSSEGDILDDISRAFLAGDAVNQLVLGLTVEDLELPSVRITHGNEDDADWKFCGLDDSIHGRLHVNQVTPRNDQHDRVELIVLRDLLGCRELSGKFDHLGVGRRPVRLNLPESSLVGIHEPSDPFGLGHEDVAVHGEAS